MGKISNKTCEVCGKKFRTVKGMNVHLTRDHKNRVDQIIYDMSENETPAVANAPVTNDNDNTDIIRKPNSDIDNENIESDEEKVEYDEEKIESDTSIISNMSGLRTKVVDYDNSDDESDASDISEVESEYNDVFR